MWPVSVVRATEFVHEDWDTGTPPASWPYKDAPDVCPAGWQGNVFHGWGPGLAGYCQSFSEWAQTGLSTTHAYSGTRSFFIKRVAGVSESGVIDIALPTPYPSKIYVAFRLWLDSNFINFNTPTSREPSYHFLFTNSAQSGTGLRVNMLSKVPYIVNHSCGANEGGFPYNRPYTFFDFQDYTTSHFRGGFFLGCYNLLDHLNEWLAVEFMFDSPGGHITAWINGTVVYDYDDTITDPNFTSLQISNYMSSEDGTGFDTSYYIDDFVVADTFISLAADTTPPVAPTGLAAT